MPVKVTSMMSKLFWRRRSGDSLHDETVSLCANIQHVSVEVRCSCAEHSLKDVRDCLICHLQYSMFNGAVSKALSVVMSGLLVCVE